MFDRFTPRFVKKYANLGGEILRAFESYVGDVASGEFPMDEHSFHINEEELAKVIARTRS